MFNLINKSVKNISLGISNLVTNLTSDCNNFNIDLCSIESMNLNYFKCDKAEDFEKMSTMKETQVLIVLHSNFFLNLYYFEEFLDLKCFFTNKFLFPITSVEKFSLGLNRTYTKDLPLIALISNSVVINNQIQFSKNDYLLKIYSLKNKKVVHTLRFKNYPFHIEGKPFRGVILGLFD